MNQTERVLERLEEDGSVSNFWAIQNYILRLGAIIHNLRQQGYRIVGEFGDGKNKKNFTYTLISKPYGGSWVGREEKRAPGVTAHGLLSQDTKAENVQANIPRPVSLFD